MSSTTTFGITARDREVVARYCASITGDPFTAEDLAQQTLLEAWRKADSLRDEGVREPWLIGIARNVCLRWLRARSRNRLVTSVGDIEDEPADDYDLEVELERDDLARLLDRAMALLPPETRDVLIQKYVEEWPQAEVAARLGLTEGAVEARLHRGRLALRRILTTELRDEASEFGLVPAECEWFETRLWCSMCGQRRLVARYLSGEELMVRCPACHPWVEKPIQAWASRMAAVLGLDPQDVMGHARSYKVAWNRFKARSRELTANGIIGLTVKCIRCGGDVPVRMSEYEFHGHRDLRTDCPHCGHLDGLSTTTGVAMGTPEARRFWSEQGRIRTLPALQTEAGGVPAIVERIESLTSPAVLEVVIARDTARVIAVHGARKG